MTKEVSRAARAGIPEGASLTSVVLLTVATTAAGVSLFISWHTPLALAALVSGYYVLHLLALRRSARDAVISHAAEAQRIALLREQEFEQQLRDVARMEPELEKERARVEQQWLHLKGLVDERESRKKTIKENEVSLESVREEAATALAAARFEVRARKTAESELRDRIAELETDRARAVKALRSVVAKRSRNRPKGSVEPVQESEDAPQDEAAQPTPTRAEVHPADDSLRETAEEEARAVVADAEATARALVAVAEAKLESARVEEHEREQSSLELARQIEELEAARVKAEEALQDVADRRSDLQEAPHRPSAYAAVARTGSMHGNGVTAAPGNGPHVLDQPRLRAWQFIAHKRNLARRSD